MSKKSYYHLVAGKVLFKDPSANDALAAIELNTMLMTNDGKFTRHHIGKAQQALQIQMFKKLEDPKLVVIDVFLLAISNLGQMTEEEFTKVPENMVMQERVLEPTIPLKAN